MITSAYDIVFVARRVFLILSVFFTTISIYTYLLGDEEGEDLLKWMHLPLSDKQFFVLGIGSVILYVIFDLIY